MGRLEPLTELELDELATKVGSLSFLSVNDAARLLYEVFRLKQYIRESSGKHERMVSELAVMKEANLQLENVLDGRKTRRGH